MPGLYVARIHYGRIGSLIMDEFTRHEMRPRGRIDHKPPNRTWDYLDPQGKEWLNNLALITCSNGHTCRIVSTVHRIGAQGALSPSYVCPIATCGYHAMVRFVGWNPDYRNPLI